VHLRAGYFGWQVCVAAFTLAGDACGFALLRGLRRDSYDGWLLKGIDFTVYTWYIRGTPIPGLKSDTVLNDDFFRSMHSWVLMHCLGFYRLMG